MGARILKRWRGWAWFSAMVIWASPYSCFGALVGTLGCLTGGTVRRRGSALEFHGGLVRPFLDYCCGPWVSAITFGHTILGRNAKCLDECRSHEWVHVRQYQKWGPFFGPAYLSSSVLAWLQGKNAYRDNFFEREAFGNEEN